jgi:hypothetical protein
VIQLAADRIDPVLQHRNGKLVARRRQRCRVFPSSRTVCRPGGKIEDPVIGRVGIAVFHEAGNVVEPVAEPGEPATGTTPGKQWPCRVPVELEVEVPELGNDVVETRMDLVLHTTGKPESRSVRHQVHVRNRTRQVPQLRPGTIGWIEDIDSLAGPDPVLVTP